MTGNVTKGGAGAVRRGLTGETGWHAARQRRTRQTTLPAISGRPAREVAPVRRHPSLTDLSALPCREACLAAHYSPRPRHGQCPCAKHAQNA